MKQFFISRKDIFLFFISFSFLLSLFLTVIADNEIDQQQFSETINKVNDYASSSVIDIYLSNNNEKIFWDVNGYSPLGIKVLWSKQENPTYPTREGDKYHYFTNQNTYSDTITNFAGDGYYYVRVCEYNEKVCGVYSNQIKVYLGSLGNLNYVISQNTEKMNIATTTIKNEILELEKKDFKIAQIVSTTSSSILKNETKDKINKAIYFINKNKEVSEKVKITAYASFSFNEIKFKVSGKKEKVYPAKCILNSCSFDWDVENFPQGKYTISLDALKDGVYYKDDFDIIYRKNEIVTKDSSTEKNETLVEVEIPLVCKNLNILNQENCDNFLLLPSICQEYGIKDKNNCLLFTNFPKECQINKMTSEQSCANFLGVSGVCFKEKIYNKEDCKNYNLKINMPELCQQSEFLNQEDCKKLILSEFLAPDCLANNINSKKECNEFLKEKNKEEKLDQKCLDIGIKDHAKCNIYLSQSLDKECIALSLNVQEECEQFILSKYSLAECFEIAVYEKAECENYLFNKYINKANCTKDNYWGCFNVVENNLGKIVKKENKFNELEKIINNKETVKITEFPNEKELTPLKNEKEIIFKVLKSEKNVIIKENNFVQTSPVILVIDSDEDGLSDEAEKRLGTDFSNPDTDNDTYLDGEEVALGYNPLGSGKLEQEISAIDKAILNNETIEQPKDKGMVNDNFVVEKIDNNLDQNIDSVYAINGKSTPNTIISLYIYSDVPMLVTVKSDQYGNWKYELKHELNDGEHEVYAVVNDETGKIKEKSLAMNFFVKEARAVSVDDFIATINPNAHDELSESEKITSSYVFISLVLVGFAIFLFVIMLDIIKKSKINLKKN